MNVKLISASVFFPLYLAALALGPSTAQSADSAATLVANRAYSTYHDGEIDLPNPFPTVPIATLSVPVAGSYVISAKLEAFNTNAEFANSINRCKLTAGGDFDTQDFSVESRRRVTVVLHVVHTSTSPMTVTLQCSDHGGAKVKALFTKITAMQVAELTNTHF